MVARIKTFLQHYYQYLTLTKVFWLNYQKSNKNENILIRPETEFLVNFGDQIEINHDYPEILFGRIKMWFLIPFVDLNKTFFSVKHFT